jgi:GntR family transcriptional regulator
LGGAAVFEFKNEIDKSSPMPLYSQLKQVIREEIDNGKLKPGDVIPTEFELIENFQLSRTTVRQAISELVTENVLYRRKGVGTFVAKPKIDLQYMGSILSYDTQLEHAGLRPRTEVISFSVIDVTDEKLSAQMDMPSGAKVIELIRVRYAEEEANVFVKSYLPYEHCKFILELDMEKGSLYEALSQTAKTKVVTVHRQVEAQLCTKEDQKHMNLEKGFPIQSFISKAYSQDGTLIEYSIAHYRGDRNKFCVEIVK